MDPTSLRALALSTLKSKRKRPVQPHPEQPPPLPSRPVPVSDSYQLDYGQDDAGLIVSQGLPKDSTNGNPPPNTATADVSVREEGEISDEEEVDQPPSPPKPATPPPPPTRPRRPTPTSPQSRKPLTRPNEPKPSLLDRITDPTTDSPSETASSCPRALQLQPPIHISTQQVRPNLHMNQIQYDKAKDLTLDVLGWGVPPEYLVDCGLSREFVFYGFQELNLRLPNNLDTTGLPAYSPETVQNFAVVPSGPRYRPPLSTSAPAVPALRPPTPPPPVVDTPNDDDQGELLLDMERQRRQELIARKAVQASRRARIQAKENTTIGAIAIPPSTPSDITVDDFLKSIATPTVETRNDIFSTPMDIDIDIPQPPEPPFQDVRSPMAVSATFDPSTPLVSSVSSTSANTVAIRVSPEPATSELRESSQSRAPTPQYPVRRGVKRPVASDFVDVDPRARASTYDTNSNGYSHPPVRRRTTNASFVNVRQTKCVIDLSDSESEEEDEPNGTKGSSAPSGLKDGDMSALKEKEREIQRMKDLIARHEQKSLLKKLGLKAVPIKSDGPSTGTFSPMVFDEAMMTASSTTSPMLTANSVDEVAPETPMASTPTLSQPSTPTVESPNTAISTTEQEDMKANGSTVEIQGSPHVNQMKEEIDMDVTPSSQAQIPEPPTAIPEAPPTSHFRSYNSLFTSYPTLRLSLLASLEGAGSASDGPRFSHSDELSPFFSTSSTPRSFVPDLLSLRTSAWAKHIDPNKQICQFEIPGGGTCRDAGCDDLHLSQLDPSMAQSEPDDEDTARFLCSITALSPFEKVLSTLQDSRLKHPTLPLETRVAQVMDSWASTPT